MKPKPNKGVKCVPGLAALHRTAKPPLRSGLSAAYPGVRFERRVVRGIAGCFEMSGFWNAANGKYEF